MIALSLLYQSLEMSKYTSYEAYVELAKLLINLGDLKQAKDLMRKCMIQSNPNFEPEQNQNCVIIWSLLMAIDSNEGAGSENNENGCNGALEIFSKSIQFDFGF